MPIFNSLAVVLWKYTASSVLALGTDVSDDTSKRSSVAGDQALSHVTRAVLNSSVINPAAVMLF